MLLAMPVLMCAQTASESDSLFDMTQALEIHFDFTPEQWERLQPPDDLDWDVDAAFRDLIKDAQDGKNFHSEFSTRPGLAGYLGVVHQYGLANVTIGDETIPEVGVRYKGNGTLILGHEVGKYSFKIDFNEYHDEIEFRGLKKINLNNCVSDPSMLREAISYELFREAGVPSCRTGWAKVYLTVGDEIYRKYLGLYLVVEQVDKRFLKRVYGSSKGLLVKPSTFGAFRHFGNDWKKYEAAYVPKTDATVEQQERLMEFARLVHVAPDKEFAEQVEEYLDIEEFISFLAVNVLLANLDSFLGGTQNFYAYLNPETNKFELLPWDLDHSFGAFELLGTRQTRRELSINQPQVGDGQNRLIERLLEIPNYRQRYHDRLEELMDSSFDEARMFARIDRHASALRPLMQDEGEEAIQRFEADVAERPSAGSSHPLKEFVSERRLSVRDQLDGKSEGHHLSFGPNIEFDTVIMWIGLFATLGFVLLLNSGSWVWGIIAGFRQNAKWGLLNMFFYPICPLIYGYFVRREFGLRAAIMTTCTMGLFLVTVVAIINAAA